VYKVILELAVIKVLKVEEDHRVRKDQAVLLVQAA
jgi:hypothetical protein